MSIALPSKLLNPPRDTRLLLIKWVVAILVPVMIFTLWSGEGIVNSIIAPSSVPYGIPTDLASLIQAAIFTLIFYLTAPLLAGYLLGTDSGRRTLLLTWLDVFLFAVVPLTLIIVTTNLFFGLALCVIVWGVYFFARNRFFKTRTLATSASASTLVLELPLSLDSDQRASLIARASLGGFWYGLAFALVSLVVDLAYFFTGSLSTILLIWAIIRTIVFPVAGYFLGQLGGRLALWFAARANRLQKEKTTDSNISASRAAERAENLAKDQVPNDLPLRSRGAQRFFLLLLLAFVIFYPVIDPYLFSFGTDGRLGGLGDAGYYVILALGLNIVVGFAGLLDLGYVAFFAIGAYSWGMVGSSQFTFITGIPIIPAVWSWLFWPMIIITAFIAASFGVLLGAPTLRLRGDYLAIVTLGFGEIVPVVFLELDKYTRGANGIIGVYSPAFPGANWSTSTPYYYLILALIVLVIFANVRLRDSRLGRAWIAIREDEIAAASSGVNLVNTKLFAFAAGAFFSGVAGAYHAAKLGGVSPDDFSFGDSVIYLSMVVIGGIGSIPGVIVGAIVVYAINQLILAQLDTWASDPSNVMYFVHNAITQVIPGFTFGNIRNLIFGVILVVIMIFRPEGLIPSARRRRELHRADEEEVEMGSLDALPGTSAFESEIHVE
ncbi:MAG: branched-chain amino acid ABC transporter permease [Ktedonobacteraceae bacterium]